MQLGILYFYLLYLVTVVWAFSDLSSPSLILSAHKLAQEPL